MDERMDTHDFDDPRIPLGVALAALPMPAPERSAWPLLAARLQQSRPRSARRRWPIAVAAGLLALALLPRGWLGMDTPADLAATAGTADDASAQRLQVAGLMAESAQLERLVAAARDDGATSGTAAAVSLSLEDRLRTVDADLSAATSTAQQLPLWQQRVDLMRDMAAIEASRHYLASQGGNLDVALVAAY